MPKPLKTARPTAAPPPAISLADDLLVEISALGDRISATEKAAQAEIAAVQAKYAGLAQMQTRLAELDHELKNLMRRRQAEIFNGNDQVCRPRGRLFLGRESRLVIPGEALSHIKNRGWLEAVRISESINRVVVDKWSDERLQVIGAFRRESVTCSYELFSAAQTGGTTKRGDDHR